MNDRVDVGGAIVSVVEVVMNDEASKVEVEVNSEEEDEVLLLLLLLVLLEDDDRLDRDELRRSDDEEDELELDSEVDSELVSELDRVLELEKVEEVVVLELNVELRSVASSQLLDSNVSSDSERVSDVTILELLDMVEVVPLAVVEGVVRVDDGVGNAEEDSTLNDRDAEKELGSRLVALRNCEVNCCSRNDTEDRFESVALLSGWNSRFRSSGSESRR